MRRGEPWYWRARDGWYVQVNRRQVKLSGVKENKAAAYEAFYKLMAAEGHAPPPKDLTLGELVARFRLWSEGEHAESTRVWYESHLKPLLAYKKFASRRVADITPSDISAWVASRKLGQSTKRGAITVVKSLYSFAEKNCRIKNDQIRHMERPPMKRRQAATEDQRKQIMDEVKDEEFQDFLTAVMESGCRPGEIMRMTGDMVNLEDGVATFHGKTSGETGKDRVVYLTESLRELLRKLIGRHGSDILFLNTEGNPWDRNAVRCRFRRLRAKLGIKGVVCYSLRHAYVTDALEAGVPIAQVAELAGHSDTKTVSATYSHLKERREHMRRQAEQATKKT
jgi:integrase